MSNFKKVFIILLFLALSAQQAFAEEFFLDAGWSCKLRVVVTNSTQTTTKSDILFLTGFSDRADNHMPLFKKLSESGHRVISFDYPSHGETSCLNLNFHDMISLEGLAEMVLLATNEDNNRKLNLIGWSTGGLLAYRMLQRGRPLSRKVSSAVLLTPGLAVYPIPGDSGFVTQETLLSNPNPPHLGEISPTSPLFYPLFGADLMATSLLARFEKVPSTPILMILGGDETDVYAKTPKIKRWFIKNKLKTFQAYQCPGAKHEVDNEVEPIGGSVRSLISNFINGLSLKKAQSFCKSL